MTWRRLAVLLHYLPREAAYVRRVGGEAVRWGDVEHLLATLIDIGRMANYLTIRANFTGKPQPPTPMRRPGERPRHHVGGRRYTIADMQRKLDHWGEGMTPVETRRVT